MPSNSEHCLPIAGGTTQLYAFLHGLAANVKDQLIAIDLPDNLDSLIALTAQIDITVYREKERFRSKYPANSISLWSTGTQARRIP